jgi:sigma-B regulation protein RsbU (phosphoserine phosphatase)
LVSNGGNPYLPSPWNAYFNRSRAEPPGRNTKDWGLGLYIASEIARAHNGTLEVSSTAAETRFTFRMPLDSERLARARD